MLTRKGERLKKDFRFARVQKTTSIFMFAELIRIFTYSTLPP